MKTITFISIAATIIFAILCRFSDREIFLTLFITSGTTTYHFVMRYFVGGVVNLIMRNHADYNKNWYRVHPFEEHLYQKIKVKKWKKWLPAYQPEWFSMKEHTFEEIAQVMCQAEVVHEVIVVFSFLPLGAAAVYGSFVVFLITSVLAAGFDMTFVIVQRYNRPRIIKLAERRDFLAIDK